MSKRTTVIIPDNVYEALRKYMAKEPDRLHPHKQSSVIVNALKEYLKNRHIEIDDETDETKEVHDLLSKGTELIMTDKYDDALKALDKATEIDPMNADAWLWKGKALSALGKTTEADAAYTEAKELLVYEK